jgi:hypothetical protein
LDERLIGCGAGSESVLEHQERDIGDECVVAEIDGQVVLVANIFVTDAQLKI